jgi:hypothetical protein
MAARIAIFTLKPTDDEPFALHATRDIALY